eukprot:m.293874 g.293874  ORF g.293874 m.293874 type:complete len:296 (-) comp16389_c0_seq36:3901-4788(-)
MFGWYFLVLVAVIVDTKAQTLTFLKTTKIPIRNDTFIEIDSASNWCDYEWLLVGKHTDYGKKRILVKAEMPAMCSDSDIHIVHATLNIWFHYAHAASGSEDIEKHIDRNLSASALMIDWECDVVNSFRYSKHMFWPGEAQEYGLKDPDFVDPNILDTHFIHGKGINYPFSHWGVWNITSLVREWCEGTLRNNGVMIWDQFENDDGRDLRFTASECSNATIRPYFEIKYVNLSTTMISQLNQGTYFTYVPWLSPSLANTEENIESENFQVRIDMFVVVVVVVAIVSQRCKRIEQLL